MNLAILFGLLILVATGSFAAINWAAFTTPGTLSLLVANITAPLGLIMLAAMVLLTMVFLVYVLAQQTSALLMTRRHLREHQADRELVEKAEGSRLVELRSVMAAETLRATEQVERSQATILARIDEVERALRTFVEQNSNSLAASLGELEDRLDHPQRPTVILPA